MGVFAHFWKSENATYFRHPKDVGHVDRLVLGEEISPRSLELLVGTFRNAHLVADDEEARPSLPLVSRTVLVGSFEGGEDVAFFQSVRSRLRDCRESHRKAKGEEVGRGFHLD